MSITKKIAFGAAATWFSRGVTIVLALTLMPILLHHMRKEDVGIWLLLAQSSALIVILDLGLSVVLTRRIALAKGKSGTDPDAPLTEETCREIADLVATGKRLYHIIALATFVISGVSGCFYLRGLHLSTLSLSEVWLGWLVLCLSQAFGMWAQVWNCLLNGVGAVGWDAVLGSFIYTMTMLAQIIALFSGGGVVTLALVTAVGLFAQRYVLLGFARLRRPDLFKIRGKFDGQLALSLVSPSLRAWATGLGNILVLNTDQFFIASLAGGAILLPAYRAAFLVFYNLDIMSVAVAGASAVFVSHLWQAGKFAEVSRLVLRNLRFGMGIMAACSACILALGPRLFDAWLGQGNFIGYAILGIFFVLMLLEVQCIIITQSSRATEDEAFAFWSLGAGVLKLALSVILGLRYGLLGIAASALIAHAATNGWYMVYRGLKRLRIGFASHVTHVLIPVTGLFAVVFLAASTLLGAGWFESELADVVACSCVSGLLLAAFFWFFVLDPEHRERIFTRWQLVRT